MGERPTERMVLVGRVAGPFGIRGELRLSAYTEDPLALLRYRDLKREDGAPALTLTGGRAVKDGVIVRAVQSPDRNAAETLKGLQLYVSRAALPEPDEDEFYLTDLIGLTAFDPQGEPLGRVKGIQDFGAGDILEIDPGGGQPTWLAPFTRETVPHIDVAAGRLTVARPAEVEAEGDSADG